MGETILGNRYEILRKIGDGGMAFVYEAKDRLLNRTVALKVLRPEFVDDEEFLGKFKREAEAVASLSHPNIVNVYDVGEEKRVHYIVMEYVEGKNLKEIIKDEGTLDEYTALEITKQIAMALSAAHKKGIVHRDIKPHNILISNEDRNVKVTDFGIAKAVSNSTMTNIGTIIGSVHYFSPEQAKGKFVSTNADLYSLGIVLYEMLVGKVPFRGDSPISIALQHINDELEFTKEEEIRIPQSVRTIIKKLTVKSTVERYQSAEELIEDIEYIEKNIDLDFIKEYDNYATKKLDVNAVNISQKEINVEDDVEEEVVPTKKNKKSMKKWKIAAALLVLILVGQLFFIGRFVFSNFLGGNTTTEDGMIVLPDFKSMTLDEAQREIQRLELNVGDVNQEFNADIEKGNVIYQMPSAGSQVNKGEVIDIVISLGPKNANIPNLVGMSLAEAKNIIKENKLEIGSIDEEYSDSYAQGIVMSQSPNSGSGTIEEGDDIDLVISKGPKEEVKINVPNIVGLTLEKAEEALTANKLKLGNIKSDYSNDYPEGVVIMQTPGSGADGVKEGQAINVTISKGPKEEVVPPTPTPPTDENTDGNTDGSTDNDGTETGNTDDNLDDDND